MQRRIVLLCSFLAGSGANGNLRRSLNPNEKKWISETEATLWYEFCDGDEALAVKRMKEKAEWRASIGRVSMSDCARFFGSDGYTVCLEPLRDNKGRSIVFSYGIPRGNIEELTAQTIYLQERIIARSSCLQNAAALTIIDTRANSFRAPDQALRLGGIQIINSFYPWSNQGATVFVALPPFIRRFIQTTKTFFPKETFDRFNFVDDFNQLAPAYISPPNLPQRWGGRAEWSLRYYVPARCLKERTLCKPPPQNL